MGEGMNTVRLDIKKQFEEYLKQTSPDTSNKPSAYLKAMDLLTPVLKRKTSKLNNYSNIYDINSPKEIEELYNFILIEQREGERGIFKGELPDGYWKSNFYSAALGSYKKFLESRNISNLNNRSNHTGIILNSIVFSPSTFQSDLHSSNLIFSQKLITRYIASLATKPFVLLSGLSGSGKTKLAQAFAMWICENESQYKIVPVGADWTNREPLLGYVNALDNKEYILPENGALELLIEANKPENKEKPYFLILDEMNLSHVERYFADFLSVMESKDKFKLHSDKNNEKSGVPYELGWPKNLFVVGTVNIDETTYMFSPKVLDRANVIEFRVTEKEIGDFLDVENKEIDMKILKGQGSNMSVDFLRLLNNSLNIQKNVDLNKTLTEFFKELQKVGAEFGYRTAMEINKLFYKLSEIDKNINVDEKIDIAIMQKLLPKLHGSRSRLTPILKTLATLCYKSRPNNNEIFELDSSDTYKVIYPISLEKITRMYYNVISNGFTSYAEA